MILLIFSILASTISYSQKIEELFYCKANIDIKSLAILSQNLIYKPVDKNKVYITNAEFVVTDTLQMEPSWGWFNSVKRINDKQAILSFANQGFLVEVHSNLLKIVKEVDQRDFINKIEMGMKVPFENFIVGTAFEDSKLKNSTGMYYAIIFPDSTVLKLSEPQTRRSRYYKGMVSFSDYIMTKGKLIINYSEANVFIIYDTLSRFAHTMSFPTIENKKEERWLLKQDFETGKTYALKERKSLPTYIYGYNLNTSKMEYINKCDNVVLDIVGDNIYYLADDEEKNTCLYKTPLLKTTQKERTVILQEVKVSK